MQVLGIVACGMLEDELAHVLCSDDTLKNLILIDSSDALGLSRKLRTRNRSHLIIRRDDVQDHLEGLRKRRSIGLLARIGIDAILPFSNGTSGAEASEPVIVIDILKKALHSDEKMLRDQVYRSIESMAKFSDGILLFYGLCGNSLGGVERDFEQLPCNLFFLIDEDGKRIDDCIAMALGGNKEYALTLSSFPGVGIFFTPMWAYCWQEIDKEIEKSSNSKSRDLGSMLTELGYSKVANLDTGLGFISDFVVMSKISDFAEENRLEIIHLKGSSKLAERCYCQAKGNLGKK